MKCNNCGMNLGENDKFCPKCGTPIQREGSNNTNFKSENAYNYDRPVNQQVNYEQQQYVNQQANYSRQQNYGQQYMNNGNDGRAVKICIIIIIFVAILAAVGFLVNSIVTAIKGNGNNMLGGTNNQTNVISSESNNNTESVSQVSNTKKSSTYKVSYGGFNLYIPDNLIYEVNSEADQIDIGDSLSTWQAQLCIKKVPFQQVKQNKNSLSSSFTKILSSYNPKVSNATVETIDGIEFVLLEANISGTNGLIGCAELNSMYTACIVIFNENNDFDRDVLKNITSIISTAEYSGDTKNLEINEKINTTDINKVLQDVVEQKIDEN